MHAQRILRGVSILTLLVVLTSGFAIQRINAQVLYGSLLGSIQDASGSLVQGATVRITNKSTGVVRETTSNEAGLYTFPNVLAGTYDLEVSQSGFRPVTQTGVIATVNSVTRTDIRLEVGATTEQITVSASAALLQSDKADVHSELTTKEVMDLPTGAYRNYQSLINLVPGATPADTQNSIQGAPARGLATNINGTAKNNNSTRLDGAVNVYLWLPHHVAYVAPQETVETVSIATNNFDAEQGLAGGAAITVVTKSGTNEFHGSAFGYHTNNHLKARNFFQVGEQPRSSRNMDGATFGGPILRNKLFFFGGWEGMWERTAANGFFTVPTDDIRRGDFTAYSTIYDPATGDANGAGRTPFPNNIIPLNRQSAISRKMQDLIPQPNLPGTTANYFSAGTLVFDRQNYDAKVNWNRSDRHALFAKYSAMDAVGSCPFSLGEAGGSAVCTGSSPGTANTLVQIATIGHTFTVSPQIVVDGNVGWTRLEQRGTNPDFGTNFGLDVLGIPGTNGPDPRQSGMPAFAINGYTTLGNSDNPRPNTYADQSFTINNNVGILAGKHDLRVGLDVVRHQLNHWQPELNNPRGLFTFSGGETALNATGAAAPNQFNAYAAFLLGSPISMGKSLQHLTMSGREWQFGTYIRDRWQATQNLTLSLGLRYEYYPLMTRADRGLERYDPTTNLVLFGRRGDNPDNVGINVSKTMFAPRVGFAYRLGADTVIRSGYGITYDPLPFSRPLRGPYPATISQTFVGSNTFAPFGPLEQGIPPFTGPDLTPGFAPLPVTVDTRSPWAGTLNRGYIQSWNFILERRLPGETVVSAGYVGTQTTNQLADRDINAAPVGGGNTGKPLYPQFRRTAVTSMWDGWLSANYHSAQFSVNRNMGGLTLKGAYTFSKAINSTDEDGWANVMWNHPEVLDRNRALAGYDRTHILQLGWVYEMPFGPGKKWANGGFVSMLTRDWQVNGNFSAYSGTPFTVTSAGTSLNAPGNAQTADQVLPEVEKLGGIGRNVAFFDPLAFRAVTDRRYGSSGRNILRGPGVINTDLSLFRTFPIRERFQLQFRAEAFNASNTPHFNNPGANVSNMRLSANGTITDLGNFMSITSARTDERIFRFALRIQF
ncbi:MAG TPA: carboxypeptidase regulatory-like domain-containing protein [Bryobacteraceae bacterium]|nr:carboxypeptidase regulatory-like domain-containing protein [Bryobacteraceae bacterium]